MRIEMTRHCVMEKIQDRSNPSEYGIGPASEIVTEMSHAIPPLYFFSFSAVPDDRRRILGLPNCVEAGPFFNYVRVHGQLLSHLYKFLNKETRRRSIHPK